MDGEIDKLVTFSLVSGPGGKNCNYMYVYVIVYMWPAIWEKGLFINIIDFLAWVDSPFSVEYISESVLTTSWIYDNFYLLVFIVSFSGKLPLKN